MIAVEENLAVYPLVRITTYRWQCICGNPYILDTDVMCADCGVQIFGDHWLDVTHLSSEKAFEYIQQHAQGSEESEEEYMTPNTKRQIQIYNIRIESSFILTQKQIKEKFGVGFHVITVETEKDIYTPHITDTDSAVEAMIRTGYRALARANHPDLGGDIQVMATINKAKKEILDLLGSLKS